MPAVGERPQRRTDASSAMRELMDRWQAAVNHHRPERMADLFTDDALFQGLQPEPVRGTDKVIEYYSGQPHDLRAEFEIIDARYASDSVITAYLSVIFQAGQRHITPTHLSIVAVEELTGWCISHYHVSVAP